MALQTVMPTYPNMLLEQNNQYEATNNNYSEKDRNTLKASEQLTLKRQYSVIRHRWKCDTLPRDTLSHGKAQMITIFRHFHNLQIISYWQTLPAMESEARVGSPRLGVGNSGSPSCVAPEGAWNYIRNAVKSFEVVSRSLHRACNDVTQWHGRRTNWGAVGINCHVIFAACLGWDAQNKLS